MKILFRSNPTKPAQGLIFPVKKDKFSHPNIFFTVFQSKGLPTKHILEYILKMSYVRFIKEFP